MFYAKRLLRDILELKTLIKTHLIKESGQLELIRKQIEELQRKLDG